MHRSSVPLRSMLNFRLASGMHFIAYGTGLADVFMYEAPLLGLSAHRLAAASR